MSPSFFTHFLQKQSRNQAKGHDAEPDMFSSMSAWKSARAEGHRRGNQNETRAVTTNDEIDRCQQDLFHDLQGNRIDVVPPVTRLNVRVANTLHEEMDEIAKSHWRVARLEWRMDRVESRVGSLESSVNRLESSIERLIQKIDEKPSNICQFI